MACTQPADESPVHPLWPLAFAVAVALGLLSASAPSFAAGTPATGTVADQLITITGSESRADDGDYVSAQDALDTFHTFFIEVPEGTQRLVVDLFDMDVLIGIDDGTNGDQPAERDRIRRYEAFLTDPIGNFNDRVGYSLASYELYDPTGTRVTTKRIFGSHFGPELADGAWLGFYDSNTADTSGGSQWLDQFGAAAFDNDDGTQTFATDWIENEGAGISLCNTSAGAAAGLIRITGGRLRISDDCDFSPDLGREPSIERELDLTGFTSATMSFDFETTSQIEKPDALVVEMSTDGGATWTIIDDFSGYDGVAVSGTRSYDITEFISSQTRIRFRVENLYAGSNEAMFFDNFEILATATAAAAPMAGHWELRVDMSSAVAQTGLNGDETNAFGIRAHDGDTTAGGTEIPVYTQVYTGGINPNDSSRTYGVFPYVTSGCFFDSHDFDWDADLPSNTVPDPDLDPPFGFLEYTSRQGIFSHREDTVLSENNNWNTENVTGFTDNDEADDYGVWRLDFETQDPNDGNYLPIYITEFDAAGTNPPPLAVPEPDSFRIYLPTDAGTAPVKPYLSQYVTFVATQPFGATNPPAPGTTARYAVSVTVVNPAGSYGDIEFSSTRTVTAHFPGGPNLTYQGVALLDQGTVVSQPTVGTSTAGDIVWNPGTLAAGGGSDNFTKITYLVDLTAPAPGPAYSVDITATPASGNGTRAVWLDETGDDRVGSRAIQAFGPLCELRIQDAPATPVVVSRFSAFPDPGGLGLEWHTASEAKTVAFDLYRLEGDRRLRVNRRPLGALVDAPQGGVYRIVDPGASAGDAPSYLLVERTSDGRRLPYGPFAPAVDWGHAGGPLSAAGNAYSRQPHAPRPFAERLNQARLPLTGAAPPRPGSETGRRGAVRVAVETDRGGLHRIDAASLGDLFGLTSKGVEDALRKHGFRLQRRGEDVAWIAAPGAQGLDFWARDFDSPFTALDVYWLELGRGLGMAKRDDRPAPPDWGTESFRTELHLEQDLRPVMLLPLDPEGDHWFWSFVQATGQSSADVELDVPNPVVGSSFARLTVHLQGGGDGPHLVGVSFEGQSLGQVTVDGVEAVSATFDVDPTALRDGANRVTLTSLGGDLVFLDSFDLTYDRRYLAEDGSLVAPAGPNRLVGVAGFPAPDVRVFDLADPDRPVWLADARAYAEGSTFRAVWRATSSVTPYAAVSISAAGVPAALRVDTPSDLAATHHEVDYLVIAAGPLVDAAGALADYRRDRGLETMVVDLQDIYDEFADGVSDPRAIRDFLRHAHQNWGRPPSYAVLVGHGTWDYRNRLGTGGNLLPTLLTNRGDSLYPTDAVLADLEGDDGAPEIALGRLPVLSAGELADHLAKIQAYESDVDQPWDHRVLLLADFADSAGDFSATSEALADLVPDRFEKSTIHLDDAADLEASRQLLFQALDTGATLVHYGGHGGLDRLSATSPGLLNMNDIPNLANGGRTPVLTAVTCNVGLHGLPVADSLAEALILEPEAGAVAVFAPSGLSEHHDAEDLGDRLFRELFQQRRDRLGDAVRSALSSTASTGAPPELLKTYQLLGDPALEIQLRPEPTVPCTADCGGNG
ncbi:MAG: C25 family cysteine peptidase [Acidobacteriota bacterium]